MALEIDLTGRAAVVSGGSSGMGAAICARLSQAGAAVVVGGRDAQRAEAVVEAITTAGGAAVASLGDVGHPATASRAMTVAVDAFGGVDIVVNAAGVIHRADAVGTSDDDWRRVMSANVDGVFYFSRAAVTAMRGRGGAIVNISSTCGLVGSAAMAAYCAAKGAVTNLTRAMALDHAGEGIRINAVCPGAIDTPMLRSGRAPGTDMASVLEQNRADIPEGRIPEPEEVADLVVYLCTDRARHINGANIAIDGGYTAQ